MSLPWWKTSSAFHLRWNKAQAPHPAVQGSGWPALCLGRKFQSLQKAIRYALLGQNIFFSKIFFIIKDDRGIYIHVLSNFQR